MKKWAINVEIIIIILLFLLSCLLINYKNTYKINYMIKMDIEKNEELIPEKNIYPYLYNNTYTQNNTYTLSEIIFSSLKNTHENAEKIIDFSEKKNKSILGYYIKDNFTKN